jgi:beta-glucosidase
MPVSTQTIFNDAPWMAPGLTPDARAALLDEALTEDERYSLLHSQWAIGFLPDAPLPDGAIPAAGYVPPIPRLGIPGLYETDASLGVTNPRNARPGDTATARGLEHHRHDLLVADRAHELQLLREPAHRPRETARPGAEW